LNNQRLLTARSTLQRTRATGWKVEVSFFVSEILARHVLRIRHAGNDVLIFCGEWDLFAVAVRPVKTDFRVAVVGES
jgi:hypothetical protein